ncbi:MAG: right-handed parallel beta-helix repeat-containing protein [Flavobacteriales bacterium]|nr:right-handed parallel beta-helix repeat-containing protein [Flavobacteriales bacterium]
MIRKLLFSAVLGFLGLAHASAQITTYPYSYDFENETTGPTGCNPTYTMVEPGWLNAAGDNMDWTNDINATGSGSTGPNEDHTPGAGVFYMYLEASCTANRVAWLESPVFDFTSVTNPEVSFWYHMYGADIGTLTLEVDTTGTGAWVSIFSVSGQQQTASTDPWLQAVVSMPTYAGAPNVKFRISGTTLSIGFAGDMGFDDFMIQNIVNDDAGITAVTAPMAPFSAGTNAVDVNITNYGANTISNADVEWMVNGTPQTTFNWVGTITSGQTVAAPVNIGSYNFPAGQSTIKAWTNLPNGNADQQTSNDTLEVILCTALKGTYTLGGVTADFNTFGDLSTALLACGVDSHVVVNVNPGTYAERLILTDIPGTSSAATVTIDGGDTSLVTMTNSTFSNVYLNGADWVTITNMTLENTGTTDAYGVQLRDSAMYNTISNCLIRLSMNTGLSDVIGVSASDVETSSFTEGTNAYFTTVQGNTILGGEKGIHFEGASLSRNVGNSFIDNMIDSPEDYGIYMDDQDSIKIIGNTITNIRTAAAGDGIYTFDLMMFDISYNKVINAPDYGIYISDGNFDAVPTSRGRFINNMVSSTTDYAVYFTDVHDADVFHNTIYNTSGTSGAFYVTGMVNLDIRNNIFMSETDYAFESISNITIGGNVVDYNDYYSPASNPSLIYDGGSLYATVAAWQVSQPTANQNSIENDPIFPSSNDLHTVSLMVDDKGDNTVGILDDIDGDTRPMGAFVDMGADEFTALTNNAALMSFLEPGSVICGDSATPVTVIVRNLGDTIFNMNIDVQVTGDITTTLSYAYSDTLLFTEYDTITVGTLNTISGVNINLLGYVTLAGEQDFSNDTASHSFIARPYFPVGYNGVACDGDSALITALSLPGTNYGWYDAPTGGNLVGTGDSYMIPSVSTQSSYFLEYLPGNDSLIMANTAGNSCGGGNMFDVTSFNGTSISGFSVATTAGTGTPITVTIHYIANGTYVGNETNAAAWTTHGTYNVTSAGTGAGIFTKVDFTGNPIVMPAGATYAIYVEFPASYTNGSFTYTNAELSATTGVGLCGSFSSVNNPRSFNGAIHYAAEDCSDERTEITASHDTTAIAAFTATPNYSTVNFDASATMHQDSVSWDFGDGSTGSGLLTSHTYGVDSTYTVCLYAYSYCGTDTTCQTMDVCDSLGGNFTYTVTGFTTNFTDMSAGNPVTWHWDFGDGTTSNQQNPSHTYPSNDSTYLVTLVVINYCGDISVFTFNVATVGIEDLNNADQVTVTPNPSNGEFSIDLSNFQANQLEVGVYDQLGKAVYNAVLTRSQQTDNYRMNLTGNAKGVYFLKLSSEKGLLTKKLIIK